MARIKGATMSRKRRNKVMKMAKGYYGSKSSLFKTAKQAVMKSGQYAYVGRKQKKRDFRRLWITRISAACKLNGMNYSTMMHGLKKADIAVIPDFLGEELLIDIKIAFSLRIWHLFHVLFGSLIRFIKNRLRVRKRVEKQYPDAYQKPARTPAIQKKSLDANASDKHTPAAGKTA